jgi:hypothetical protein
MKPISIVGGFLGARAKARGRMAFGLTAAYTGIRVFRRITRVANKPALSFKVKPGEVYEIRGTRRGQ